MKPTLKLLIYLIFLFAFSGQVLALKCGRKLVHEGDRKIKVFLRCGEPDYIERRERRIPRNCVGGGYYNYYGYRDGYGYQNCYIQDIEVWTYNFGPAKFMRELIFINGVLDKINTLEYGY